MLLLNVLICELAAKLISHRQLLIIIEANRLHFFKMYGLFFDHHNSITNIESDIRNFVQWPWRSSKNSLLPTYSDVYIVIIVNNSYICIYAHSHIPESSISRRYSLTGWCRYIRNPMSCWWWREQAAEFSVKKKYRHDFNMFQLFNNHAASVNAFVFVLRKSKRSLK